MQTVTRTSNSPPPKPAARPLRVVMVDEELPYPPTSGKRIRTLNLTLRLAKRHQLTYVCHRNADAEEARQAAAFFVENNIKTVVVDRAVPPKSGVGFYLRLAANLLSPLPYSVATHTSPALRRALAEHAANHPVDVWHCEWTPYVEALRGVAHGRRVAIAHNVESVIWQRYYETETNALRRWYIGRQWHKFQRFERRVLSEVEHTVAVSDVDARRFREDFGVQCIDVVENGVDTAYFQPQASRRESGRLLFLGSLDWRPNLDGVRLLLERVFPAVLAAEPSARLCLVGRNPPESLRQQVAGMASVELHGSVPDVRPYLANCGMLVVPLRIGGGSRLKILEALASGTPVVSTRVGAEGLYLEAGRDLTVVEDIDDLIGALVTAIRAPETLQTQAEYGREKVLERYDWDRLAEQLERVWMQCAAESGDRQAERPAGDVFAMNVVHLTASTFHGGPERQMLGLAHGLAETDQTVFLSFAEGGRCRQFLSTARHHGFEAVGLHYDTPRLWAAVSEIAGHLERVEADVLCCHGYKANLLGRIAARRRKIPVVAVARGWTAESFKVRLYERLDRFHLRWMDHVVCVSEAQAAKVRRAGVRAERVSVIYNAIDPTRFHEPDGRYRAKLLRYFRQPRTHIIGAAGRLSPEKGFDVLVAAAEQVLHTHPSAGFVIFGEGPERARLQQKINAAGLNQAVILCGFRADLDRFLPHFDLLVLPSYTEGLPNVVLEAFGAGVPVVATAVGGTPEVIEEGVSGHLVPPGDAGLMAERIDEALTCGDNLPEMGRKGRLCVQEKFGFQTQARLYGELFAQVCPDALHENESAEDESEAPPENMEKSATMPMISLDQDLVETGSICNL